MLATRRARAAVAVLAESVASSDALRRLTLGDGRRSVRDVPDNPMIERAARRVGVIDHQCQALRPGGDRSERQRRTGIAAVTGVFSRNRLTIRKCGTRNLHPMRVYLPVRRGLLGSGTGE